MKVIKQTIRKYLAGGFLVVALAFGGLSVATLATASGVANPTATVSADCGGAHTSIINCGQDGKSDSNGDGKTDYKDSGVWGLLLVVINILTAGIGVVALAGIVYGAILYTSAGGNTEQVKKAYTVFTNVAIGAIAFAGMWALLNFLIPGGAMNQL